MTRIEKSIEVNVPVRTVYNQWTQFEDFPRFMEGVQSVEQLDDTHIQWHAEIGGKEKEWESEILEQVPDKRIAWCSVEGAENAGAVTFEPLGPNKTRVDLVMEYELEGFVENVGDTIGVTSHRIKGDLERFKEFIESRGRETGQWRGEVRSGRKLGPKNSTADARSSSDTLSGTDPYNKRQH